MEREMRWEMRQERKKRPLEPQREHVEAQSVAMEKAIVVTGARLCDHVALFGASLVRWCLVARVRRRPTIPRALEPVLFLD